MANYLFDGLLEKVEPSRLFADLGKGRSYTYRDVLDVSARFANVLVDRGVKPGDRVAVQVPKSIEALMLYLGTVRAGAVFLPLNTSYTISELSYFLDDAEPTLFVCDPVQLADNQSLASERGINLDTLGIWESHELRAGSLADAGLQASTQFENVPRSGDELAAILYTSGTTGRSKGAMLTHGNLLSNARVLENYWQFTSKDVLLHALPIFHTHGLFVAINTVLCSGGSMIFQNRFVVEEVLNALPRATCMMGVPTFYSRLLSSPELTRDLVSHIRVFISGSAPLSPQTHKKFEQQTGHAILERYGMTETSMNTSNPFDGERRASTVGFPLPGIDIRIADIESGKLCAANEIGVIEIGGPNVFKGYWRMPEKTALEFRDDGFFISGDLGFIDERGYVSIVGRNKDLIISGGFNIYPAEVENALDAIKGIRESAVIGLPHPDFGEGVTAVVVLENERLLTDEKIRSVLGDDLANYKHPKRVFFVDALPRNKMGKIQKNHLCEKFHTAYEVGSSE